MKKESMLYGIIGLLAGLLIAGTTVVLAVNNDNHSLMNMMGINAGHSDNDNKEPTDHSEMSMNDMSDALKDLKGDDFDKAFLEMMIAHHEGALDMAGLIPGRTGHSELTELGEAITVAQANEIADMMQWQKDWGYSSDEVMDMMHGGH